MADTASTWQTTISAIVVHPSEPCLLLMPQDHGWSLPVAHLDGRLWSPEVEQVNHLLRQTLGFECIVLRCASVTIDREAQRLAVLYVVEPRQALLPDSNRWVDRAALADLTLAVPEQQATIAAYLDQSADSVASDLRPAWARPGWFAAAEAWIAAQLMRLDYTLAAPVEQVKCWGISCVLRARTTSGDLYFKVASTLPLFGDEPRLMEALAAHSEHVPAPLAIEPQQGWMLLADVGPDLRAAKDPAAWATALRLHGQLQQAFVDRQETLIAIGCLDRRLDQLAAQATRLLAEVEVEEQFTAEQRARLQTLAPRFGEMCEQLARAGVPYTLVHGDLHGGNIALRDGQYLFFDWTDSCITHPFFDLVTMLDDAAGHLDRQACTDLRDAYLSVWSNYGSPEQIVEIWSLAEPLGALHQAISYDYIMKSLEPASKHEMAGGVAYWLRKVLDAMPA